jgi:predicted HAD superfamily Cof-like phosphohydrolase
MNETPTVPCKWCRAPTWHTGTGCCDNCWELQHRIQGNPALAARILNETQSRTPSKEFQDVRDFHQKFELLCFDNPARLTKRKLVERIEFMQEELNEFIEGCGLVTMENSDSPGIPVLSYEDDGEQDLAKQADALVDLVYVALGTASMMGLPWDWLWDDVQRANMAKVRGMTKRGHAVDVTKPPGWQGPQTERILELAGYQQDSEERDDAQ